MIFTIAWKECREHWPIWFTMVFMTTVLGFGVEQLSGQGDVASTLGLTVLAMAATYGLVCGAMMLAGEREAGTLVFLDIFLGRRGLLWACKFPVGIVLVLTQSIVVAAALDILRLSPPDWLPMLVGGGRETLFGFQAAGPTRPGLHIWFIVLPAVTLEAYAWGLLGSSLTHRVISGAVLAAFMAIPLWFLFLCLPPTIFLGIRLFAVCVVLGVSVGMFLAQSRDAPASQAPPVREVHALDKWIEEWNAVDQERWERGRGWERPTAPEVALPAEEIPPPVLRAEIVRRQPTVPKTPQAQHPQQALLWLATRQSAVLLTVLAATTFLAGLLVPAHGQLLWPVATFFLGIACGTATFAWEQSDLSYPFLGTQHFPLKTVWNVKVLFWFGVALFGTLILLAAAVLVIIVDAAGPRRFRMDRLPGFNFGTLRDVMGPTLYFGVWLVYGFSAAPVFVFLCRKMILAVLLSAMVGFAALGLWLPSVLCQGMGGWQIWGVPLLSLGASRVAMRAWTGGRIKERKPLTVLVYFAIAMVAWAAVNFAYRAFEVSDFGEPLDRTAFRSAMPSGEANAAALKIQEALSELEGPDGKEGAWLPPIAQAAKLPPGALESLPADGQSAILRHLPDSQRLALTLKGLAVSKRVSGDISGSFEHLAQILALSRSLRTKAPHESYLAGVEAEKFAFQELEQLLTKTQPGPVLLKRILAELDRHVTETPDALDCLQTECYRAGGMLLYPTSWAFFAGPNGRVSENWLAGGIAFSLEMPWEDERKTRLWRAVWAGLFHAVETPHWKHPEQPPDFSRNRDATKAILSGWLPTSASPAPERLARLLDASWLSDERLFTPVIPLRAAADRSKWRIHVARQTTALLLYQSLEKKTAQQLEDLVPKYLPELPVDPYSGQPFRYRISNGEDLEFEGFPAARNDLKVRPGQGVLWSTGPDRTDHGGTNVGNPFIDVDPHWSGRDLDLITVIPRGP